MTSVSLWVVAWGALASRHPVVAEVLLDSSVCDDGVWAVRGQEKSGLRPGDHSLWWWMLLHAGSPGLWRSPVSATEENLAGTGTPGLWFVISLLSRNTLHVFRRVFHRLLLPLSFTQRSSLGEEREAQGGSLTSWLPLILSFPTVE